MPVQVKLAMTRDIYKEVFQKPFFLVLLPGEDCMNPGIVILHLLGPLLDLCPMYNGDVTLSL